MSLLPRVHGDVQYKDPVTLDEVDPRNAYYLRENASGQNHSRIRTLYHKSTLERILGNSNRASSPITRRAFQRSDILKAPVAGRVHPDLEGKPMSTVLKDKDTARHTYTRLKAGQRLDMITSNPDALSVTVTKLNKGTPQNRTYRTNVTMSMEFSEAGMKAFLQSLGDAVSKSNTNVSLATSRVVRG